jgi:surface carbohydrate biosynthesis protein
MNLKRKVSKTIFLPVETVSRELDYKVLLAMKLSSIGYDVMIGKKHLINNQIQFYENFIYVDKGYHEGISEAIYKTIKKQNGKIVSLDEEGAVDFPGSPTLKNRYSQYMTESVSKLFFWGKAQKSVIEKEVGKLKNAIVTGHPRFILLKNRFYGYYDKKATSIINKYGNYILLNTNFGFGNNINGDDYVKNNYGNRFEEIDLIVEEDKKKLNHIINLVDEVSEEETIIIRPHPEENIDLYKEVFDHKKNIFIIREGSSIPWILSCKSMVHIDCTTSIEAAILGKKTISYLPLDLSKKFIAKLPTTITPPVKDAASLISELNSRKLNFNKQILEDHFSISLEFDFIIEQINSIMNRNEFSIKVFNWSFILMFLLTKVKSLKHFFFPQKLAQIKYYGFTKSEVKEKVNYYRMALNELEKCKVNSSNEIFIFKI